MSTPARRVLLIDDDPRLLAALERHFRPLREELELVTAPEAGPALRLLEAEPFDVVVTDILMPSKDGLEVLMELRRRGASARIIAISGGGEHVGVDSLDWAERLGARRTLRKPFAAEELVRAVRDLLEPARAPGCAPR